MILHGADVGGSSGVDTGDIGHSLRCRSSASAYLSRTFGTPTSQTRGLLSFWHRPGWQLGGFCDATFLANADPTTSGLMIAGTGAFGATYNSRLFVRNGGSSKDYWNLVFRDPTSWYHIVVSFDTTQGTQADRAKCWVNGVEQTKGASSLGASEAIGFLASGTQTINGNTVVYYGDYYTSRFVLMDGQCVQQGTAAVSSFGYQNTEINEWVSKSQSAVKAVVDAGGTNSFMLDFDNATSLTTLGYDKSSKGNNWTLNNFSLTAGTTYDWMLDVPGNSYATLNSIYPSAANITNGNLTSGTTAVRGTMNALAYDCKWEVTAGGSAVTAGVISGTGTTNTTSVTANKVFAFRLTTAGALDYKNVTDAGAWTSITTGLTGEQYPYGITQAANWNFGQAPLHASATYQSAAGGYFYDTTSGYTALCQRNLPDPAILNPEKHFDAKTQLGSAVNTGANLLAQFTDFTADLAWGKDRAAVNNYQLVDTVRGSTAVLQSNTTAAETTYTAPTSGDNCVAWGWKMGGAAVTNNNGSISSQVSANVLAGQSVVTYTGTGANATVGHGLVSAPELVVVKNRQSAYEWIVGNKSLTSWAYYLNLNTTVAQTNSTTVFNSTAPTSSVFSVGANVTTNENTKNLVALCFHSVPGYSKVGSYTGNGSADGPYVDCGFKPKYVLLKCTSAAGNNWVIYDTARDTYNVCTLDLRANTTSTENQFSSDIDVTSTGFKVRGTSGDSNTNGATYIFYAIADVPGKYSLAR